NDHGFRVRSVIHPNPRILTPVGRTRELAQALAVLRLVYGRHRPGTDDVTTDGEIALDDLRALFPGF
ncbi:hypothetical protein ACFZAR_43920, partial [Streptomyces sp. NPDC008222]|uniref:hypothetical protein n=1 Tax=Streptomyces sp. NPDC008222 TaxID=3364820 RepID=UPI0036E39F6F